MSAEMSRYRYRVDADDTIVWVDEPWLAFAAENGAVELTAEPVLGQSLWDCIAGDQLRGLYQAIHDRLRQYGKPVVLPCRCDSPALQRHMRITIRLENDRQLIYDGLVERTMPQTIPLLDDRQPRAESYLSLCSCCKRALLEPVGWLDLEDISVRLGLFEGREVPQIRHTLCSSCAAILHDAANGGNAA